MKAIIKKANDRNEVFKILIIFILMGICLISFFISIGFGTMDLSLKDIVRAIFFEDEGINRQIVWNIRLPRTLVAAFVGICLSLSGAIMQGVMRNPLASPDILGVSSGAGLVAFLFLIVFPNLFYLVPMGAFIGALVTTMIIYFLAYQNGINPLRIVLAGVAVNAFIGGIMNVIIMFYPDDLAGVSGFLVGSLSARSWSHFISLCPYAVIGIILAFIIPAKMNVLMLGDDMAIGLGMNVERTRTFFIIISSILAAAAVSVVGMIGFVGLIVPHIARLIIGSDYRYLTPASTFLGAGVVMLCDTLGRNIFKPVEISVGVIMAVFGAPFFLYLLREKKSLG